MNRRSFIKGVLAAMVAPAVLVPKCHDHHHFKVGRRRNLYIAEYEIGFEAKTYAGEWCFFVSGHPEQLFVSNGEILEGRLDGKIIPNPAYEDAQFELVHRYQSPDYQSQMQGRWKYATL